MKNVICPVNRLYCDKPECENGICVPTGCVNSFKNLEDLKESKSEPLSAKQLIEEEEECNAQHDKRMVGGPANLKEVNHLLSEKKIIDETESMASRVPGIPHIAEMLAEIYYKEPEAYQILRDVIKHIHATYGDKYQSEVTDWLDTKALLLSKNGKYAAIHSASKYIQRYSTIGFEKSENIVDIYKAIHYLVFLIQGHPLHSGIKAKL